jgi:hypothetical protein
MFWPQICINRHLRRAVALRLLRRPLHGVQRGVAPLEGVLHALHDPAPEVVRVCGNRAGIIDACCIVSDHVAACILVWQDLRLGLSGYQCSTHRPRAPLQRCRRPWSLSGPRRQPGAAAADPPPQLGP